MGDRVETAETTSDTAVGNVPASTARIRLNKMLSSEAVQQISRNTLRPLIDEQEQAAAAVAARWARPEAGDRMPDDSVAAGELGGQQLFAMPQDAEVRKDFNEAAAYVKQLNEEKAFGHDDWRVPSKEELMLLYNNHARIGGFNVTSGTDASWYWSSAPHDSLSAWCQDFSGGGQNNDYRLVPRSVRAVRNSGPGS